MCYEYEEYLQWRAQEARRALADERKRIEQEAASGKPEGDRAPQQPEPVPA
ncbi:MAG TPA: hypothetical protein VLV90_02675 [Burkholderiales bacterium]|nr:hypothetical protein [Burkholderiales bacterium]